jgi:hypothetical protein
VLEQVVKQQGCAVAALQNQLAINGKAKVSSTGLAMPCTRSIYPNRQVHFALSGQRYMQFVNTEKSYP